MIIIIITDFVIVQVQIEIIGDKHAWRMQFHVEWKTHSCKH